MIRATISAADYADIAAVVTRPPVGLRAGQAAMDRLYRLNERMFCAVVEAGLDPFFDDRKVAAFLEYLDARIA